MKQSWLEGTTLSDGAIHRLGNSSLDTRFLRFQRWIIPWNLARSVRCRNASVITFQPFSFASQPFYSQFATNYRFLLTELNCNKLRPIFVDYFNWSFNFLPFAILSCRIRRSSHQHDSNARQLFYLLKIKSVCSLIHPKLKERSARSLVLVYFVSLRVKGDGRIKSNFGGYSTLRIFWDR